MIQTDNQTQSHTHTYTELHNNRKKCAVSKWSAKNFPKAKIVQGNLYIGNEEDGEGCHGHRPRRGLSILSRKGQEADLGSLQAVGNET